MINNVQFSYSKRFAFSAGVFAILMFLISIMRTFQLGLSESMKVLIYFDIGFFIILVYFTIKIIIPAIKKEVILELKPEGIEDKIRKRFINWDNIDSLKKVKFRNFSSGIAVYLIDKNKYISELNFLQKTLAWLSEPDYNTPIIIPMQFISGNNSEIMKSVQLYFEEIKNIKA